MAATADFEYQIRWFTESDQVEFVDLYNETFGGGSDAWFEWKYLDNPRVSHVPILVAQAADGDLAGARPQVPFLMHVGDEVVLALRFGDTMVHPDHRRRGVFSRLTEHALAHYRRMSPRFVYNCPNDLSRPGFLKAGGELVAHLPSYYRIQNPTALAASATNTGLRLASRIATPAARAILAAQDRRRRDTTDVAVERHDAVPLDELSRLVDRGRPVGVTAVRDRSFLEWRYRNPRWDYRAYTATLGGFPIAAVVTGTQTDATGVDITNVVDVYPPVGDGTRTEGLRAILESVVEDAADNDLIAYNGHGIPRDVLTSSGFLPDDTPPVSNVTSPTGLVVYDLSREGQTPWRVGGRDLRNAGSWHLQYAELDAR